MLNHFVVEVDRKVIGVAVRVAGGFRFFHSDPQFLKLEGQVFRRARTLLRKAREFSRDRRNRERKASGRLAFI